MVRRTWGSVKGQISRVAASCGMDVSDSRLLDYMNAATEELILVKDWPSVIDRLDFRLYGDSFVLPSDYERMLYCTLSGVPQAMQSPWFEFVGYGLDTAPFDGNNIQTLDWARADVFMGVLDKDFVATFTDVPKDQAYTFGVYANVDERVAGVRPKIIVQGYDSTGTWIRTQDSTGAWIDGIQLEINGDGNPQRTITNQTISQVTGIIKPVTNGYVYLYVYGADGAVYHIGTYAPKDTTPTFRRYKIPIPCGLEQPTNAGVQCGRWVRGRCRRRFVPITQDNDFLLIPNLPAMKLMVQAVYYSESNDPQGYQTAKAGAVTILNDEAKSYIGLQRQKPFITFGEGMGVDSRGMYIV